MAADPYEGHVEHHERAGISYLAMTVLSYNILKTVAETSDRTPAHLTSLV